VAFGRARVGVCAYALVVAVVLLLGVAPAVAVPPAPGLTIHSFAMPSHFSQADGSVECFESPGGVCDVYQITVTNSGAAPAEGPVTITDALPANLKMQRLLSLQSGERGHGLVPAGECEPEAVPVKCVFAPLEPDQKLELEISVTAQAGAVSGEANVASVFTGASPVPVATSTLDDVISSSPPAFGPSAFLAAITGQDGVPDTQAGDHPYEFTTRIDMNTQIGFGPETTVLRQTGVGAFRDIVVDLPVGFIGSALAAPRCPLALLSTEAGCPADTRIGHIVTQPQAYATVDSDIYNMVPEHGVAAEFGFTDNLYNVHVIYSNVVPSAHGYVLRATTSEIPEIALTDIVLTLYGDPAAKDGGGVAPAALFTNPSGCSGEALVTSIHMDSWSSPGRYRADGTPDFSDPNWVASSSESPPVTGCNALRFEPSLSVRPETTAADSPTGLEVDVSTPQSQVPGALATPPLRHGVVTLPAGLTVNPAAASGLGACSEAQIALGSAAPPTCPESSKIGTVQASTPLLGSALVGSVYLATQNENPFHALLAGYIVVDDPATGTVVKVPGTLMPDPQTGQITGSFDELPQFPLSDLRLRFFGGARGELATPESCGTYTVTSDLMPWSAPDSGPDATPSDSFPIDAGCVTGFAPSFSAGSTNPQAGGFSPFTLSLSRTDGDQGLAGVTVNLPPGLLGKIAGIPLCPDANANAGTCPEASRVGTVTVGAGVGPNPLFVSGKAYLTGPYNGGPYGLVVEVPAVAGPFDLGTVAVRQSLRIDRHTAQVSAVSDAFPTILDGIPLRVRRVDVTLDRPGFTFNPTNCTPMAITGSVTSTQGASANVSSRFQAGGCRELPFKPVFRVSTQAGTSKKNGASLDVKVGSGQGQANIGKVAATLPRQLPSRLTTIQQACPQAVFDANPASCPTGSDIGIATAKTPVLTSPLTGPAYLVSHGGAAFPDLVIILQGEGVTLDLVGSIDIKKGVTSSTFASVTDAPISSFELKLPEGSHSALTAVLSAKAKGNLCGTSLVMPTTLTGQNGAQIKQSTKIAVTGCPKAKKKTKRARKHERGKKRGK